MKLEFQKIESFEKIYFNFTRKFFIVLKFLELEYSGKLDFAKLEYLKSSKSLYIFGTMVNYNIVCKKGLFGYFRPILTKPKFYKHSYLSSPDLPLSLSLSLSMESSTPSTIHTNVMFLDFDNGILQESKE